MKLIVVMSILNEGKFVGQVLQRLKRIKDIDYIHVLDGYWWHPGIEEKITNVKSLNSTDDTLDQILKNSPCPVKFYSSEVLYLSESDKRNFQLDLIAKNEKEPFFVLVLDGDEEIVFANYAEEDIYLKPMLEQKTGVGMVLCEGWGLGGHRFTSRLFQGGIGIHYHTGKPMCLHDPSCNQINDYELDEIDQLVTYPILKFKIVNYWPAKDRSRILEKDSLYQMMKDKKIRTCEFQKRFE